MHMRENIFERQNSYLDKVKCAIGGKEVVIYGAGNIGRKLFKLLAENHIHVSAFCVTDVNYNPTSINGIPVYSLSDIIRKKAGCVVIILAALPPTSEYMLEKLKEYDFRDYVDVEKDMRHILDEVSQRPTLEITSRIGCSVNCRFCPQEVLIKKYDTKKRDTLLKYETFKTCIDKTPKNLIVDFAGYAEPFLNPDILSMMQYAVQSGRDVRLYTTLVGLTEDVFQEILKLPFYSVVLHLPDKYNYSHIPLTEDYYYFLERIMSAKKRNGKPFVDKANGQAELHPTILPYIKHKVTAYQVLVDWAGNIEADEVVSSSVKHGKLICDYSVNQDHNVLLPDGTVVLCCMDWGSKCVLGNLVQDSYEEIVHGQRKRDILYRMTYENDDELFLCRKCTNAIEI